MSSLSSLMPRCELCGLCGDELEKNEEVRAQLVKLEKKGVDLQRRGKKVQGLWMLEQKVELMERHWEEFSTQVL